MTGLMIGQVSEFFAPTMPIHSQVRRRYKMKSFQFRSLLRLSVCFFALACFSSVGYASSPSEADNVHFCLPLNLEDKRDSQYVARKQALNLNVGEPRTVRLIYFLPNDRSFNAEVVQNMKDEIRNIQTFYAEQMQAHGYGNKTFRFETDAQGEPLVHRVDGQHPDSHYLDYNFATLIQEIEQTFDLEKNIYFIVVDNSIGRAIGGVSGRGGRLRNGGIAIFPRGFSWRTAAHELGHAFGLEHDFHSDAYMMSYGIHKNRLSTGNAEYLTVHPYFNSNVEARGRGVPAIKLTSSTEYPASSNSVSIQLELRDTEGLHQVILFAYTTEPHPAAGFHEVKTFRGLGGEKDAVIELDYDGVIPSLGYTSLSDPSTHLIRAMVVDTDGHMRDVYFSLLEISPYHIATLEKYRGVISSITFSPEGTLASTGNDGMVKLWDIEKKENIATFEMSLATVATFSPDGTILASGAEGHRRIRLWDVATGKNIATLNNFSGVRCMAFSPDGTILATGPPSTHGLISLWDVSTRNFSTLEGHTSAIQSVAFSPDGKTLASASMDSTVNLWDVSTRTHIATLEGHRYWVRSVAFSPDGTMLASGSQDNTVRLWDVSTHTHIATLREYHSGESVRSVAFSPDGTMLAAAVSDETEPGTVLWDVSTRTQLAIFQRHFYDGASLVAFSPDGETLAVGSAIGDINLWDTSEWIQTPRPQSLVKISGDNQQGTPRAVLANPYVVEVRDQQGNPLQGAQVTFTVAAGDGKLSGRFRIENVTTDANGRAQSKFSLGPQLGTNTVKASIGEMEVIFNAAGIETSITPVIGGAYHKWNLPNGAIARLGKGRIGGGVAFSPDGQRFAVAGNIGIWLYDMATSRELALLTGHTGGVNAIAFSPDGTKIASGSDDRTVKVWDVATGGNIATLEGHTSWINSVAFSPDGMKIASGSRDQTIKLWDVSTGETIATLEGHTGSVNTIAFSSDGTLVSGSDDFTVKLWDVSTQTNIATLEEHWDEVKSVVFSPDGKILASGADNGTLKLWNVATRETIATYRYVTVNSIAFSPDGSTFAVATNNHVKLWDVATGKKVATVEEYGGISGSVAFSPNGTTLAIEKGDTVKLWEIATQNISILSHTRRIKSVAFSPNGAILASGSEGVVELWDVSTRTNIASLEGRLGTIHSVVFSPDGTTIAGAGSNVHLWDVSTRTYIGHIKGLGTIRSVGFSPDGTTVAFGFPDGTVKLWDVETQTNIATLEGHTGWTHAVAFSPDGATIASGSNDRTVKLWDVSTRTNIATLEGHTGNIRSIAFSPDGTKLASGSNDRTVKLWDVSTGENIATLEGHTDWVKSVSFSPDGTVLASAGSGQIKLWDIATKRDVVTLEGHNRINSIVFSPDGTTLASGSEGGTALLWDMSSYVMPVVYIPDANLRAVIQDVLQKSRFAPITVTDMASLTALDASNRDIRDLTGLEFATNLTELNLVDNPLSAPAINTHIPVLQNRGVEVLFARSPTPDFNKDGVVDFADFLQFAVQFGLSRGDAGYDAQFDLNGDGIIGFGDFLIFVDAFGE